MFCCVAVADAEDEKMPEERVQYQEAPVRHAHLSIPTHIPQGRDRPATSAQMDVLDRVEATRGIRSGNSGALGPQVPTIAMTAYAMTGDRERFLETGMNDYIAKPVQVEELKKALERVVPLMIK